LHAGSIPAISTNTKIRSNIGWAIFVYGDEKVLNALSAGIEGNFDIF
jgi:hypothetical protein